MTGKVFMPEKLREFMYNYITQIYCIFIFMMLRSLFNDFHSKNKVSYKLINVMYFKLH